VEEALGRRGGRDPAFLDNMTIPAIESGGCSDWRASFRFEASGNVTLANVRQIGRSPGGFYFCWSADPFGHSGGYLSVDQGERLKTLSVESPFVDYGF